MRLAHLPGTVDLTYCTNIHAGESWDDILASLAAHVPAIKAQVAPDIPFGIGLRLSGIAARQARQPGEIARLRALLNQLGAYVFTINAFPYGPFHGARVKENVYLPDWRAPERVAFTADSATLLAAVLPEGMTGSISTVPAAFAPNARLPGAQAAIAANLAAAVADLVAIERDGGKRLALALEPEPCCHLETVEQTLAFFHEVVFGDVALAELSRLVGVPAGQAEALMRRHLGVCYDVCHGAVEYEDPVAAIEALLAASIAVPKIQLSAALRVPTMSEALLDRVMAFDEGVYLHQTIVREAPGAALTRHLDLPEAAAAFRAGGARGEWRIHCHVPVFLAELGGFASTRAELDQVLAALRLRHLSPHLEVETYTWDILPGHLRSASKADDIARELGFVSAELRS